MFKTIIGKNHFDVLLVVYNFANAANLDQSIADTAKAGIGVVAMKVMAGGSKAKEENVKSILGREGAMLAALKFSLKNPKHHLCHPEHDRQRSARPESHGDGRRPSPIATRRSWPPACARSARSTAACAAPAREACAKGLPVPTSFAPSCTRKATANSRSAANSSAPCPAELAGVRCSDCSECTVHCANGVRVVERLSRAQEIFA